MSSDNIAIRVDNVGKCYEMYGKPSHRLWQTLTMGHKTFYKEFWALRNINFEVKKGECVGIIGRNGSGKSTLLQIIAGTLTPTTGNVEVNGRVAALLELGSGFNPEFTGRDNIYMNASILGLTKIEINAKYDRIVAFADIGEFIDQPVKTYSSGMIVRLAFAVQVTIEPDILIVDEALSVGDVFFQQKCFNRLRSLQKSGTTLLFVSHDLSTVKSLCDKCIYLEEGKIKCLGASTEICDSYYNNTTKINNKTIFTQDRGDCKQPNYGKMFRIDELMPRRCTERSGSFEVKFTALDVYDESGSMIFDCLPNQNIRVIASFIANKDFPAGANAGLLCRNERNLEMFALNTDIFGTLLGDLKKDHRYTIEWLFKNPLNAGKYLFSIGLKPNAEGFYFYDRIFNASLLEVRAPQKINHSIGGCVYLEECDIKFSQFNE